MCSRGRGDWSPMLPSQQFEREINLKKTRLYTEKTVRNGTSVSLSFSRAATSARPFETLTPAVSSDSIYFRSYNGLWAFTSPPHITDSFTIEFELLCYCFSFRPLLHHYFVSISFTVATAVLGRTTEIERGRY